MNLTRRGVWTIHSEHYSILNVCVEVSDSRLTLSATAGELPNCHAFQEAVCNSVPVQACVCERLGEF